MHECGYTSAEKMKSHGRQGRHRVLLSLEGKFSRGVGATLVLVPALHQDMHPTKSQ